VVRPPSLLDPPLEEEDVVCAACEEVVVFEAECDVTGGGELEVVGDEWVDVDGTEEVSPPQSPSSFDPVGAEAVPVVGLPPLHVTLAGS